MRRVVTILLVLILVIAGTIFTLQITAQEKEAPEPDYEVIVVEHGEIISTVSATGSIEPEAQVDLLFKGAGRIAEVLVQEGDQVEAGDLIATLESDDLEIALAQAQVNLAIALAQQAKLLSGATELDLETAEANVASARAGLASAEAALESAQAAYNDLVAGPSEDEKQAAAATLERARIVRDQAQAAYDQVAGAPNVAMLPQALQLQQATVDYETAAANYRVTLAPPKASQIAAARAQIAQAESARVQAETALVTAEANLERLLEGATEEDIAVAQAQVTQAELGVQQAELALEGTRLVAPMEGVITALNVRAGELAGAAALPAATITDISQFHIDIAVDEIDISKITEGQSVEVTIDALPEAEISGHVDSISVTPSALANVVSYPVTVVVDESETPLRTGLSATASIITAKLSDVLAIPNRSIQFDRTSGRAYVDVLVDGVPTTIEIQVGLRNEQQTQVVSGLTAGDQLVIQSATGLDRLRSSFFGG